MNEALHLFTESEPHRDVLGGWIAYKAQDWRLELGFAI